MQERMGQELERLGIMIECNPTSNYLIGTFRRYDLHPIFRFNNSGLVRTDGTFVHAPQLSVSINTDDLGIFDTSLEGEYAVLAAALEKAETPDGRQLYTKDSIYQYLEHVRQMGLEQSFYMVEEAYHRRSIPKYGVISRWGQTSKESMSQSVLLQSHDHP